MAIDPNNLDVIDVSTLPTPPDPTRIKIPVVDLVSGEVYLLDGSYYVPKGEKGSFPIVDKSPMKESDSTVPSTRLVKEYVEEKTEPLDERIGRLESASSNPKVEALSVKNVRVSQGIPFEGKSVSILIYKAGEPTDDNKLLFHLGDDFSLVRLSQNSGVGVIQNGEQVGDTIPFTGSGLFSFTVNDEKTEVSFWVNDVAISDPITLPNPITSRLFTIDSKDEEIGFIKVSNKSFNQRDIDEIYSHGLCGDYSESKELFNTYTHAFISIGFYKRSWVNMGKSNVSLNYISPIFNIKDFRPKLIYGNTDPSIPPMMLGQEYYNVKDGKVWKCLGKPNTRQYEVNDWCEILTQSTPKKLI